MKTLIWKEWREQRLFFFLAIGIIALSRAVVPVFFHEETLGKYVQYEDYANSLAHFILPILFSLFLGAISFTNEFTRNTKPFLLSQPITVARLFWVKYSSALALLLVLVLLSHLTFGVPFENPLSGTGTQLPVLYLFLSTIILYSATCFSSLLLKNSLPAIICTPFILVFGISLILPFIVSLFLISPYWVAFNFLTFSAVTATFLIPSFIIWHKVITKDVSVIKTVLTTVGIIFILSFGSHAVATLTATVKLNKVSEKAKVAGIELTPEEIIPLPVLDRDNAALVYQQAFELADKLKDKYKTEWEYMPYESKIPVEELTTEQKRNISRIMKNPDFKEFYALIEQAVNMPACRFDIEYEEGPAMLLLHTSKMRSMARLIVAKTYILSEEKKYSEALQSAKTGLRLGDSLTDEPIIISQLVRIAVDDIAVKSLNLFINKQENMLSGKDYHDIIFIIEKKSRSITGSLEGELVLFGGYVFKMQIPLALFFAWSQPVQSLHNLRIMTFGNFYGSYLGSPIFKGDYAFYIKALSETINYSQEPYFSIKDKVVEWEREISSPSRFIGMKHIVSSMMLPALGRTLEQQARYNATLDSFKLALALKIYREKHGNYPDNLSSVSPEIIPELPLDPFTGGNYIYRREGKGFIVYSVGPNEKDDGGIYDSKQKQDDISFKVTN